MNEFEKEMLSIMKGLNERLDKMENSMNEQFKQVNERLDKVENRLDALEETAEITRGATNYNCEKLDELTQELKRNHLIA